MIKLRSIKKGHHKTGKSFVLMFNRVSMYGPVHPFSIQAIEEFHRAVCELLKTASPVVLLHSRGQFFIEDEPLDSSLNYFKMSSHFKKTKVASIAVLQDVQKREVEDFLRIFLDDRTYPTADQMKAACGSMQIMHIRINHVSYQKVTEDDRIVPKATVATAETLCHELNASRQYQDALGMIAGKLLMDEVDQDQSLKQLLNDPVAFSKNLVAGGAAGRGEAPGVVQRPVGSISEHLTTLGHEVRKVLSEGAPGGLSDLAAALVQVKVELREAIHAQNALGILMDPSGEIRQQTEELSDSVILELLRKEYDKGKTSVERLAVVLQRIVASDQEVRRLLPRMRDCLVAEGMPLSDFWEFIKHLSRDRQNDQLAECVKQGAEAIGVDEADLTNRWRADPSGVARFLYLATEIERQAGSAQPLCDILVDFIERFGPKMLNVVSDPMEPGEERLRKLASSLHIELIKGLRGEAIDPQLVDEVEVRLKARLDASVEAIRAELATCRAPLNARDPQRVTLLQRLEDGLPENQELKQILKQLRAAPSGPPLDENDFQQIFERIQQIQQKEKAGKIAIPDFVFNQEITRVLLAKEISRSARYETDLSGITLSWLEAASALGSLGSADGSIGMTVGFLSEIQRQLRDADWIGTMDENLFIAILPMTTLKEAHLTARRLLKHVNSKPAAATGPVLPAKMAGSVVHFDKQVMANADAFIHVARSEHAEMILRLRNLQEFM
jgi:hypothetical protein